jgi:hypothetical protein
VLSQFTPREPSAMIGFMLANHGKYGSQEVIDE